MSVETSGEVKTSLEHTLKYAQDLMESDSFSLAEGLAGGYDFSKLLPFPFPLENPSPEVVERCIPVKEG